MPNDSDCAEQEEVKDLHVRKKGYQLWCLRQDMHIFVRYLC
jgi:hypothetical protein